MRRSSWIVGVGALALLVAAALITLAPAGHARAATYHVNFDTGQDERNGLTDATAWKHAPGDPEAKGVAAKTALGPGDKVLFAAKVRYRGAVVVTASGSAEAPIVFSGATPDGAAVIDGSDPATGLRPCASAEDCGGAAAWQKLVRFESPIPLNDDSAVFSDAGPMRPAQSPNPKDDFYRDEIEDMSQVDSQAMAQGRVKLPREVLAGLASGGGRLALWIQPNLVTYRPILEVDGDSARFDPTGLKFYTDRPERAAVIDHVSLIDVPGEYVVLPNHTTVVAMLPAGATKVSVASGRFGFRIRGGSHLVFRNLDFENLGDGGKVAPFGVAIFAERGNKPELGDILIENNTFRNFVMPQGQGPIIARNVNDLRILGNKIDTIVLGSGIRLGGPATKVRIENNDIRRIGRTAIGLLDNTDVIIRGNRISDVKGVHGNGISPYLNNHNVQVVANTVLDAKQPATFEGAGDKADGQSNNLLFANNLFVGTPDSLGSLISWGAKTRGVVIRNNTLIGGTTGLRLNSGDTDVTITDNIAAGLLVSAGQPPEWRVSGNEWTALTWQQQKESPRPPVSGRMVSAASQVRSGKVPAEVCAVIRRHSLPADDAAGDKDGAVGADLRCP